MVVYDRRSPVGQELAAAFLAAEGPLSFEDLVQAPASHDVRDVAAWIGHALEAGFIEEVEEGAEVRRYRLRARGRRVLGAEKRGRSGRRAGI